MLSKMPYQADEPKQPLIRLKSKSSLSICIFAAYMAYPISGWSQVSSPFLHDPLATEKSIPASIVEGLGVDAPSCDQKSPPTELDLFSAVVQALCTNPRSKETWQSIQSQAAQLGVAQSAYLPKLEGTSRFKDDHASTDVIQLRALSSHEHEHFNDHNLNLSWTLLDFGARSANVTYALQSLIGARETHLKTLQAIFLNTAKDYFALAAAQASVLSTEEIQRTAQSSMEAATQRVNGGVAPISDQLQAQTAYAKAVFNHAKANGVMRTNMGRLALDIGLPPDSPLQIPPAQSSPASTEQEGVRVHNLLDQAQDLNPNIRAAQAQLAAAQARLAATRSDGLPTLSLIAQEDRNNQPVSESLGTPPLKASGRDRFVGIQINWPIFEGFSDYYKERSALAEVERLKASLAEARQQVAHDVWESYQTLQTDIESLQNASALVNSAREQLSAARKRYDHGAANILELMSAQSALADALQQQVEAVRGWQTDRILLAASVGKLDPNSLESGSTKHEGPN